VVEDWVLFVLGIVEDVEGEDAELVEDVELVVIVVEEDDVFVVLLGVDLVVEVEVEVDEDVVDGVVEVVLVDGG
jgi:DnaJ-class molecular chaperone